MCTALKLCEHCLLYAVYTISAHQYLQVMHSPTAAQNQPASQEAGETMTEDPDWVALNTGNVLLILEAWKKEIKLAM